MFHIVEAQLKKKLELCLMSALYNDVQMDAFIIKKSMTEYHQLINCQAYM